MKEIKVIDLLNMIAEGKEVPESIKYKEKWYKLIEYGNKTKFYQCMVEPFELFIIRTDYLNDTVEIIEEDNNKIEKLDYCEENTFSVRQTGMTNEDRRLLDSNFKELGDKINEIIDKLNNMEE